jgi:hypothetical protein
MSMTSRSFLKRDAHVRNRLCALAAPLAVMLTAACGQISDAPSAPAPTRNVATAIIPAASAAAPIVVELYQSQGCSSCPPANDNVNALADQPNVIALSFAVTYWDQLGWKDSFARPQYTARQEDYARAANRGNVSTPQVVINGGPAAIIGHDRKELEAAMAAAAPLKGGPAIELDGSGIALSAGQGGPATVWLVRYDPKSRDVPIRAGENGGRTLPHRGIVRELIRLGDWKGTPVRFAIPRAEEPGLNGAVLVQRGQGGPITAARRL